MFRPAVLALGAAALLTACGGGSSSPAPTPGGGGGGTTISGKERIGWDQAADDAAQVAGLRFAIYVDGARSEMTDISCGAGSGPQTFSCSGKGPDLARGSHTLELAAFSSAGEGPRSSPLVVTVGAASTSDMAAVAWPRDLTQTTVDGVTLQVEKVAEGLEDPVDAAFVPDGRLFVVERSGRVRVVDRGAIQRADAFTSQLDSDGALDRALSIAVDPDFGRSHIVYLAEATTSGSGDVYRLARYRELNGKFAERAVLFQVQAPPLADAAAILRVGSDRKLYLAAGAEGFPGTLQRLNLDGTMPSDQAGTTPAVAEGIQLPDGLAVDAHAGIVWIADEQDGEGHVSGVSFTGRPVRAVVRARHPLPGGSGSAAFYAGSVLPGFENTLLIASSSGRHIERIRFSNEPDVIADSQTLLQDVVGPIQVVAIAPDGSVYFCTHDTLGRLTR